MNSTQLERIPLHSWATWSTIPGNSNVVPWRTSVVPAMAKYRAAASAEASAEARSSQATAASGSGTMKIRNASGKAAAAIHLEPRNRNPPAATRLTIGERHQGEVVVQAEAPTPGEGRRERREADSAKERRAGKRAAARGRQRRPLGVEQVPGDQRHQQDVGMQVAAGGVQHQPRERLNEQQRQQGDPAEPGSNSQSYFLPISIIRPEASAHRNRAHAPTPQLPA